MLLLDHQSKMGDNQQASRTISHQVTTSHTLHHILSSVILLEQYNLGCQPLNMLVSFCLSANAAVVQEGFSSASH
uniref:Uncharacterized protein n=1 Tax=Rhizophora mucronata TaxID=61149 RepID=A0A2P2NT48_RHIMU